MSSLRTAGFVVVTGYAVFTVGASLDALGSDYHFPEPGALMILRVTTLVSFAVVGGAWWLHLSVHGEASHANPRGRRSFWLFALATLILAIGEVALFQYYAFTPEVGFRIDSRLGVLTVATGITVVGYVVVATGFWLASRARMDTADVVPSDQPTSAESLAES